MVSGTRDNPHQEPFFTFIFKEVSFPGNVQDIIFPK